MKHLFFFFVAFISSNTLFSNEQLDKEIDKIFQCIDQNERFVWPASLIDPGVGYQTHINVFILRLHKKHEAISAYKMDKVKCGPVHIYRRLIIGEQEEIYLILLSVLESDEGNILYEFNVIGDYTEIMRCAKEQTDKNIQISPNEYVFKSVKNLSKEVIEKLFLNNDIKLDKQDLAFDGKQAKKEYEASIIARKVISKNVINEKYLLVKKNRFIVLDLLFTENDKAEVTFIQSIRYNNTNKVCEIMTH